MSKKLSLTLTAIIATVGLTAFSISNAFALDGDPQDTAPLTSAKQLCKEATKNFSKDKNAIKAKGLSSQKWMEDNGAKMSQAELDEMKKNEDLAIKDIKDYKKKVCAEAKTEGQPLTSAVQLCKEATKNYKKDTSAIKKKGLSAQKWMEDNGAKMSQAELDEMKKNEDLSIKDIKDYKKKVCAEAKAGK